MYLGLALSLPPCSLVPNCPAAKQGVQAQCLLNGLVHMNGDLTETPAGSSKLAGPRLWQKQSPHANLVQAALADALCFMLILVCAACGSTKQEALLLHAWVTSCLPAGCSRLMLLLPTKFCAMPTIVPARLVSPWW